MTAEGQLCNFADPQAEGLNSLVVDPQCRRDLGIFRPAKPQSSPFNMGADHRGGFCVTFDMHMATTNLPRDSAIKTKAF